MSQRILSEKTQENLEILRKKGVLENFYLAGGTGLALQLKHRLSIDLDFFTKKNVNSKNLIQEIKKLGNFSVEKEDQNTLAGEFQETKITFLKYNYPCLFSFKKMKGIKIADMRDIGCMKISAISSRGSKKDFIDVFFICKKLPLKKLLGFFENKYKEIDYNMIHILKSLVYFKDAEKDPMPKMIELASWGEIKDFFQEEVKKLE